MDLFTLAIIAAIIKKLIPLFVQLSVYKACNGTTKNNVLHMNDGGMQMLNDEQNRLFMQQSMTSSMSHCMNSGLEAMNMAAFSANHNVGMNCFGNNLF